jgi:hypothetical protein
MLRERFRTLLGWRGSGQIAGPAPEALPEALAKTAFPAASHLLSSRETGATAGSVVTPPSLVVVARPPLGRAFFSVIQRSQTGIPLYPVRAGCQLLHQRRNQADRARQKGANNLKKHSDPEIWISQHLKDHDEQGFVWLMNFIESEDIMVTYLDEECRRCEGHTTCVALPKLDKVASA